MIPFELTRQHVFEALKRINLEGIPTHRASTKFCLDFEGRHYAPKYVISEACRALMPGGLTPDLFTGGAPTNDVLTGLGFTVVACNCGGLVSPTTTPFVEIAAALAEPPAAVATAAVVTACVRESPDYDNETRVDLVETMINEIGRQVPGPFLLVLPAGYFESSCSEPGPVSEWAVRKVAALLAEAPPESTVVFGLDGRRGRDQLALAVRRDGLLARARKFFAVKSEADYIQAASDPFAPEQGVERVFAFLGKRFYLAVCYDTFGVKRLGRPSARVDAVLNVVHGFAPPGEAGSGAGYFARYGMAGASRAWACPVYGAATFGAGVQANWPTGVVCDPDLADLKAWTYGDNRLAPDSVVIVEDELEPVRLALFGITDPLTVT